MDKVAIDALIEQVRGTLRTVPGYSASVQPGSETATEASPLPDRPLASLIDHTLLKADATPAQVEQLCAEARQYSFASVCVNSAYVPLCQRLLKDGAVAVCTVVGFPLGAMAPAAKAFEARQAIADGAREIDMVIAIGRLKSGDYAFVLDEIRQIVEVCHSGGALCKVIIETALLTDEEKIAACLLVVSAQADFVKTSTGFSTGGATAEDVALMRRVVGPTMGVKASGGVRTLADVRAMSSAGATRIGASAGVQIMNEATEGVLPSQPSANTY